MSSIMSMLRPPPGPGGPLPPPHGLVPGPLGGMPNIGPPGPLGPGPGGPGPEPELPIPPEVAALMKILGVPPNGPPGSPGDALEDIADQPMSPTEHIQAAMMHLMMAFTQEGDHSKGAGIVKGMGALQGILAGAQKAQAAGAPPPALGG